MHNVQPSMEKLSRHCSFVDHNLAQHGAEKLAVSVGHAPSLDIDVPRFDRLITRYVQSRFEKGVVHSGYRSAHVGRLIELALASLAISVDNQLVQIVHVITVRRFVLCNRIKSTRDCKMVIESLDTKFLFYTFFIRIPRTQCMRELQ